MTTNVLGVLRKVPSILLPMIVIGASLVPTFPQRGSQRQTLDPDGNQNENRGFHAIDEEMKSKQAIRHADKEYQENLVRARDLSFLGAAIVTSYSEKHALDNEDIKKLEKIEKLAKGIRNAAGGSEDDTAMDKPPADMDAAVKMLGTLSNSLKEEVQKTPKKVISAVVIDKTNVLLELVRVVRKLPSKA